MSLLIPTSLKWRRNGFPVDTYCPLRNKIEMQRSVGQVNSYYFTLSNGFQLFFALIFISIPLLALIIARVCTRSDVLWVNVKDLCELCFWGRMTALYYVHNQLLGLKPADTWRFTSDLYFGDAVFESRQWHWLSWLGFYGDFLSQNFEAYLKLDNIFPLLVQSEDLLHYSPESTTCP